MIDHQIIFITVNFKTIVILNRSIKFLEKLEFEIKKIKIIHVKL